MSKKLAKAVGFGGANLIIDVRVVQYLLNCVPYKLGGPRRELVIDGFAGPGTVDAIRRFQKCREAEATGCLNPAGPGSGVLEALLSFDPFPARQLPYTASKTGVGEASGGKGSGDGASKETAGGETKAAAEAGGGGAKGTAGSQGTSPAYGSAGGGKDGAGGASESGAKGESATVYDSKSAAGPAESSSAAGKANDSSGAGAKDAKSAYQDGDPWGFYNPASPYYGKAGFAPNAAGKGDEGKSAESGAKDSGGKAGGGAESSSGAKGSGAGAGAKGESSSSDPWGFFNPASPYFRQAGKAPIEKKTNNDTGKATSSVAKFPKKYVG